MNVYYKLFIVICFNEIWCKLPEDGDYAELKELKETLAVNCVFVGAIKCLMNQMQAMNDVKALKI